MLLRDIMEHTHIWKEIYELGYLSTLEFFYIFIFGLSYYHSSVSRHMCWTILQCMFLLQSEAHGSLQKPAFLSAIEDRGLRAPKPTASVA